MLLTGKQKTDLPIQTLKKLGLGDEANSGSPIR